MYYLPCVFLNYKICAKEETLLKMQVISKEAKKS